MILGNNTAYKANELFAVRNRETGYINQTNVPVKIIHVLAALIKINNASGCFLDGVVRLGQNLCCLSLSFITNN